MSVVIARDRACSGWCTRLVPAACCLIAKRTTRCVVTRGHECSRNHLERDGVAPTHDAEVAVVERRNRRDLEAFRNDDACAGRCGGPHERCRAAARRSLDCGPGDCARLAAGEEPAGCGGGERDAEDCDDEVQDGYVAEVAEVVVVGRGKDEVGAGDAEERA